jgi:putative ABC transport system permease protein
MALPFAYHWRNLFVRKTTTALTVLVVAAVIGTFSWMFSFTLALRGTLSVAGDPRKLMVLRGGSTAEAQSAIAIPDFNKLSQLTDIAVDEQTGRPLLSPESLVQVSLRRKSDGGKTTANIAVRGVLDVARQVHQTVKITSGRWFDSGAREIVVGEAAARQFAGLEIGEGLELGFGGDRKLLNAYNRTLYSSAGLRLREEADPRAVIAQIEGPAIQLTAMTEAGYWTEQTGRINGYLVVAYVLAAVMFLAAIFAVAITMFSAVAGRTREIGMLRTLGFSSPAIVGGFMLEAVLLCVIGGAAGCAACAAWLAIVGGTKDMYGTSTFSTLAFDIRLTPLAVAGSFGCVALVGLIGALGPAWRASRLHVISVLREG